MSSQKEIEVTLTQSFSFNVQLDTPISNVIKDPSFIAQLTESTPHDRTLNQKPKFEPAHLTENDTAEKLEKIIFTLEPNKNQVNTPFKEISLDSIGLGKKGSDVLKNGINKLSERLDSVLRHYPSPKIIRLLVQELRVAAINNEFDNVLKKPEYANNCKLLDTTYSEYCHQMYIKYKSESSNNYLKSLFAFDIEPTYQLMHENLASYSIEEVQKEIESVCYSPIEVIPNHPLVKFFEKWKETLGAQGDGS